MLYIEHDNCIVNFGFSCLNNQLNISQRDVTKWLLSHVLARHDWPKPKCS